MLDPQRPIADYLDDFVHGVLDEQDAARVQAWLDQAADGAELLAAAERRKRVLTELAPVEASERLIRKTLEGVEMKATRRSPVLRIVARTFLSLAALALIAIGLTHAYYYRLAPSPYNVRLMGQNRLLAGSEANLRLAVLNNQTHQLVQRVPVEVSLKHLATQQTVTLASYQTDTSDGLPVKLPDWPTGNCLLQIAVDLPTGREVVEEQITLTRSFKVMLSTDKPLYQPGQIIHLRSLALRRPDLKPVAAQPVLYEVLDSKGNIIFKQRDTTSEYGIASADCQLASEINTGEYQLRCTLGDTVSERTVKVEKYVLPKFKIALELDKSFYAPGDKVSGTLNAKYFFGQPVAGGEVKLQARSQDVASVVFAERALKTDDEGSATFDFALPPQMIGTPQNQGRAQFQLFATVVDSAGQTITTAVKRQVTQEAMQLEVIPEGGMLVPEQPNRIFIHASYIDGKPAVAKIKVNSLPEVTTNELGVATIEVVPSRPTMGLTVVATDDKQARAALSIQLACGTYASDFVLRADKAVYRGGDTMQLTALGGGVEPVFVDLIKDGQSLLSRTIDVQNGAGKLEIDLPPEVFGSIELVAYRLGADGLSVRKSRLIFVHQARELKIAATLDQPEYRPGGTAKLRFKLTDADGKPTPGALSLAAVDEAVFSVLSQRPGLEQAFFLAEQEWLKPIYTIYPSWSPAEETTSPPRQLLEEAVFSLTAYTAHGEFQTANDVRYAGDLIPSPATPVASNEESNEQSFRPQVFARSPITLVTNTYPEKVAATAAERQEGLRSVAVAWFVLISSVFVFGVIMFAVLQPKAFMIVTGVLAVLALCGGPMALGLWLMTPMGREMAVTAKSEVFFGVRESPTAAEAVMAAPPESAMPEDSAAPPSPAAPPRVRQYFPETLLWQPELVTNDAGEAELTIDLADSITTWRLSASAVSAGGQLGDLTLPVKVFQSFFVDINLPVSLTRNDEVSVPVVVYNYLDKPQKVELQLDRADWFALLGDDAETAATQTLELQPGEVRSLHYRMKVRNVGYQQLKVTATGGGVADAIERSIDVVPNGVAVELVQSGTLDTPDKPQEFAVTIPDNAVAGSVKGFVKFHGGGFSQLVEGLDAIFQMPYGCFEQTSSTTYPNVLALDYLRTTKKSQPQIEAKARQYIHLGYQRLVSFEVAGGGFDWFGNPPANRTLSAYGLQEFVDMARVHDVDPQLIQRTRDWLLAQRKEDGSWEPEPHMLNDGLAGSVNRGGDAKLAASAYIAWSVFHSLPPQERSPAQQQQLELSANFLIGHRPEAITDPYVLATVAMALAAYDPKLPELERYLAQLDLLKKSDDKSAWWEQPADAIRPFHGGGQAGQVETTAMAGLAMLTAKAHGDTAAKALHWLVAQKDERGTWHSTQATVLALRALLLGTNAAGEAKERKYVIKINGQQVEALTVPADQTDVVQQIDLSAWLTKRDEPNQVSIAETTDTSSSFQAVFRHYLDVADEPKSPEPLAIEIVYDRERLNVDETVTATATIVNNMDAAAPMVILDLPIPGGFTIERGELDELVGSRKIERYQITPRQAIVYLRGLEAKHQLQLNYRLKATMPVKVSVPRGEAYEYYNPAKRGASQPAQLEATIKA